MTNWQDSWGKEDVYREQIRDYYYIYFWQDYYIARLNQVKQFNIYTDLIKEENTLSFELIQNLSSRNKELKKAHRVATNIQKKTILWRSLKKEYPLLLHKLEPDNIRAFQNLHGLIKLPAIIVEPQTLQVIRTHSDKIINPQRNVNSVNLDNQKIINNYSPQLQSLMQLSLNIY